MEDDAEGEAGAGVDATDSVAQVDAIEAARAFHRAITGGEENGLAFTGGDDFGLRLRAGLLLDEDKFTALPVATRLAEQENHLQREGHVAIEILVQTIVAAGFVVQYERGRARLTAAMANFQECRMVGGIRLALVA